MMSRLDQGSDKLQKQCQPELLAVQSEACVIDMWI